MTRTLFLIQVVLLSVVSELSGQSIFDVERYNGVDLRLNARSIAVGNAFGALGGNSAAASINPAGLAAFPTSEFQLSTGIRSAVIESDYLGETLEHDKLSLNLPSFSFNINNLSADKEKELINSSFSISLNRTNSFNQQFIFSGENDRNSILNNFAEEVDYLSINNEPIDSSTFGGMAYFAFLVDPIEDNMGNVIGFEPSVENPNSYSSLQRQSLNTTGHISDLNFSASGNYQDWFLFGGTLGVPILRYEEISTFQEINRNSSVDNYNSLNLRNEIEDEGSGVFAQVGVLLKPVHFLRLGASYRSPTRYNITRTMTSTLEGQTDARNLTVIDPRPSRFSYILVTPMQATLSAAFVFGKAGFLSFDYFYQNAANSRLSNNNGDDFSYLDFNQDLENTLRARHQYRLGAEVMLGKRLALRGGYSLNSRGVQEDYLSENTSMWAQTFSGGIGYREPQFFVDFGLANRQSSDFFQPYALSNEDVEGADIKERITDMLLTIGFTF